jgi:hypothetical protein
VLPCSLINHTVQRFVSICSRQQAPYGTSKASINPLLHHILMLSGFIALSNILRREMHKIGKQFILQRWERLGYQPFLCRASLCRLGWSCHRASPDELTDIGMDGERSNPFINIVPPRELAEGTDCPLPTLESPLCLFAGSRSKFSVPETSVYTVVPRL